MDKIGEKVILSSFVKKEHVCYMGPSDKKRATKPFMMEYDIF